MLSLSIASPGTAVTFLQGTGSAISTSSSFHGVRIHHKASVGVPAATVASSRKTKAESMVMMSKRDVELKKQVARILTVRREREIEEGIGKRLSRKLVISGSHLFVDFVAQRLAKMSLQTGFYPFRPSLVTELLSEL